MILKQKKESREEDNNSNKKTYRNVDEGGNERNGRAELDSSFVTFKRLIFIQTYTIEMKGGVM